MYYGYKIEITEDGKTKYNICRTPNETLLQLEYYLKFPPYVKNRTIRILDITKKEVKDGILDKLPWCVNIYSIYRDDLYPLRQLTLPLRSTKLYVYPY